MVSVGLVTRVILLDGLFEVSEMTPLGLVVSFSMGSVKPDPWVLVQDNIREDRPENPPLGLHRGPVWWMDFKVAPWPPIW